MEIFLRPMVEDDAIVVVDLCSQLGYDLSIEQVLDNIKGVLHHPDNNAFVAIFENRVVGWIGVSSTIQIETEPYCEIRGLVVDERCRQRGVGKLLVDKAAKWGKEKGLKKLRVRSNRKRAGAHAFYGSIGFRELKEQKVFEVEI